MPEISFRVLRVDDIFAGDVLVCRSAACVSSIATAATSKYVHAAICTRLGYAAEVSGHHVKEVQIQHLLNTYDHIAVLRQPGSWGATQVKKLQDFVAAAIARKAKFNVEGIRNFEERRLFHQENLNEKLTEFFADHNAAPNAERESYFCSELVAAAHVAVGIILPSAAVVYDPATIAPEHFGDDFTFGIFFGYLTPYEGYAIPSDDEFLHAPRIDEIWGQNIG